MKIEQNYNNEFIENEEISKNVLKILENGEDMSYTSPRELPNEQSENESKNPETKIKIKIEKITQNYNISESAENMFERLFKSNFNHIQTSNLACPISGCTKVLKNKYNWISHVMAHTGEKPFKCTFCPIRFM